MENNKLSTGLNVWLWIIFVLNILATIVGIVVALGASVVGATLGLGSIYVVLCFISVILQIIVTVSIGILLFAHKKIGLVLIFAPVSYTHLDVYKRQVLEQTAFICRQSMLHTRVPSSSGQSARAHGFTVPGGQERLLRR